MSTNSRFRAQFLLRNSAVQFARSILRSENQEWRHAAWGPFQYAAQRVRRRCMTQNCRRVLRHTFGIVSKNPPCLMILQNLARFLSIVAKVNMRAVLDAVQASVRAYSNLDPPGP